MSKQITTRLKQLVIFLVFGSIFTFPGQLLAADSTYTPEAVYTEPDEYPFDGNLWNSGKGVVLVLPDTVSGEWINVPADETTGVVGGVINQGSGITITVYAGEVSYDLSLQGIYNYVRENGFQEAAYVSCNGAEAVRFISGDTSEINLAVPGNGEVIQITVKAADNEIRNRYADWIFSSVHITVGAEHVKIDSDTAYDAVYEYIDETLGVDNIHEYNGFITMDEETEDEYVIKVRSYTGAYGWYYVQKETGDVSVAWKSPITNELEERQYLFTIGS